MSRPQDNPTEHERMTKRDETDETENTNPDMSETETAATDELAEMNVYQRNETTYIVGNPESGNAYVVNMCDPEHEGTMTCQCGDYRYRAQTDENRACKHIQKVIQVGKSEVGVEQLAHQGLKTQYDILDSKVQSVMQQLTNITANASADAQNQPASPSVPASDAAGSGQQMESITAEEAAQKLQKAFDNVVEGFKVQANGGRVWVNKSPSAPDTLPGPGNVELFYAFLADPDMMQYDPDEGPGQYFKNYLEPSDVEQYISEVLE